MSEKFELIGKNYQAIAMENAFRVAGFFPFVLESTEQQETLFYMFNQMNEDQRADLLFYARFLLQK